MRQPWQRAPRVLTRCSELIVSTLAGQQRPDAADADTIEGVPVSVFAVPIAGVPAPAGSLRKIRAQRRVNHAHGVDERGSSADRRPNRTNASASGLTISDAAVSGLGHGRFLIGTNRLAGDAASAVSGGATLT